MANNKNSHHAHLQMRKSSIDKADTRILDSAKPVKAINVAVKRDAGTQSEVK